MLPRRRLLRLQSLPILYVPALCVGGCHIRFEVFFRNILASPLSLCVTASVCTSRFFQLTSCQALGRTPTHKAPSPPRPAPDITEFNIDELELQVLPSPENPAPPPPIYRADPSYSATPTTPGVQRERTRTPDALEATYPRGTAEPEGTAIEESLVTKEDAEQLRLVIPVERQKVLLDLVKRLNDGEVINLQQVFASLTEAESVFFGLSLAECVDQGAM